MKNIKYERLLNFILGAVFVYELRYYLRSFGCGQGYIVAMSLTPIPKLLQAVMYLFS